jgi:hypothetical protein
MNPAGQGEEKRKNSHETKKEVGEKEKRERERKGVDDEYSERG